MKNKKSLFIILGVILVLIICLVVLLVLKNQDTEEEVTKTLKEDTYTMYVSINPLVKFEFVETYYECTNMTTKKSDVCSEYGSRVLSYELVNDDAVMYFEDTDFTGMNLIDVLSTMRDVLIEEGIEVELFTITTDWELKYTKEELIEEILENSTYDNEFSIEIDFEESFDEEELLESNTEIEEVEETQNAGSSSSSSSNTCSNGSTSEVTDNSSSSATSGSDDATATSCTPKKFSNTYTYVYETKDACKAVANDIFYDIYDNVDSRVELWSCDEIVDDCGTTWYGISFQIYDNGYISVYY